MTEDNDAIVAYLQGDTDKLTKPREAKLERLYFCYDLYNKYGSKQKVIRMMASRYKEEYKRQGKGYSQKTAMRDFDSCQYVFGATASHSKDFHIEILLQRMAETRQVAKLTNNATALVRWDSNYAALIEKFFGDKDVPDYKEVQLPEQIFSADPKLLNMEPMDEKKLQKEMAKLLEQPTSELPEYQDVQVIEEEGGDE